jgi:hypothetical protein
MVKEFTSGLMEDSTLDNIKMGKSKEKENTSGQMEHHIKVLGNKVFVMVSDVSKRTARLSTDIGKMTK